MALSVSTQASPVATRLVVQTSATATADNNITNATGSVYMVDIDNTANAGQAVYVKLYDNASPTVGTTAPDIVCLATQGIRRQYVMPEGVAFGTAISMCCVTAGGTAGTTSPSSAVIVRLLTS